MLTSACTILARCSGQLTSVPPTESGSITHNRNAAQYNASVANQMHRQPAFQNTQLPLEKRELIAI
jgi:hypothetical protein